MGRPRDVRKIPDRVGKLEAIRLLSLGVDKFNGMVERGELPKPHEGGYDPVALVKAYAFYVSKGGVKTRLDTERVRKLERENALLEGSFIPADEVEEWFEEYAVAIASAFGTFPARLSIDLLGVPGVNADGAVINQVAKDAVSAALRVAAEGFRAHYKVPPSGADRGDDRPKADAVSEADAGRVGGRDEDPAEDERGGGPVEKLPGAVHDSGDARVREPEGASGDAGLREPDVEE